jgi:predicted RNA-binding protein associated with RNAse of E/G family
VEPGWVYKHNHRSIYWFERPYNLVEVYERDGQLKQLYVHIASLPKLQDHRLLYIDHELDVVWRPGQAPLVADEAEFLAASREYGYSAEFQSACWRAVDEALELVRCWKPTGPSTFFR